MNSKDDQAQNKGNAGENEVSRILSGFNRKQNHAHSKTLQTLLKETTFTDLKLLEGNIYNLVNAALDYILNLENGKRLFIKEQFLLYGDIVLLRSMLKPLWAQD